MNKIIEISNIEDMIYEIRGKQVMLDQDLALLYGTETKRINESVKRNIDKFPERFSWFLRKDESYLRSQIATSNIKNSYGGRRYKIRVFTEQGVAMLATILKTPTATSISVAIMDAFVSMRKYLYANKNILDRISTVEYKIIEHDDRINELFNVFDKKELIKQKIFFNGEVYDAYSLLVSLIMSANNKIILIDNYIDLTTLDMLSKNDNNIKIIIYTLNNTKLNSIDIDKYNHEYHNLEVRYTSLFHDRFLIIDNINLYYIGASIKDVGKKCFAINRIEDISLIKDILNRLND